MAALEDAMSLAAQRSSIARRCGDVDTADYWAHVVDNLQAQITLRDREQAYRILVDNRHG